MRRRVLIVVGTRPEAVKLAPVIRALRECSAEFETIVCLSGQHRELLAPLVEYFDLRPDVDLSDAEPHRSLSELAGRCLQRLDDELARRSPDWVVVQGDTTTAAAAAMAAFYRQVRVVHVEAGLRTGNLAGPFPEEFNRRVVALAAALHCAPTERAAANLRAEGIADERIVVTGNTAIDALLWTVAKQSSECGMRNAESDARTVLITAHRRENIGPGLANICEAVRRLATAYPDHRFLWPVHPNPLVESPIRAALEDLANVELVPPCDYPQFVAWMSRTVLILTDSGGVQEEAPSLRKPVLVLRSETERPEGVEAGCAELVGTDVERIVDRAAHYLDAVRRGELRPQVANPYGDGHAAERIVAALRRMA
jgi:UDP-N-acetylglucosamine 2-epimerase (non-hydrolysing)